MRFLSLFLLMWLFSVSEAAACAWKEQGGPLNLPGCYGECPKNQECVLEVKIGFPPTSECKCKKKTRSTSALEEGASDPVLEELAEILAIGE